ncbi:MAG: methylmalonyl Co-A mutase-associated GTPase MeaB [Bacteroidetes bacterium]|nr:methylmalonyl Co-A mutase-associated GTPase MeaB [Bacteroidota bacterium]
MTINSLIENLSVRSKISVARIITLIENNNSADLTELQNHIFRKTGNAYRIGITGPPGAGKSTITNQLTKIFRSQNKSVGIIAVDPTSPFTGGALLGDRIRMSEIGTDELVLIRSMASRGSLGGLSKKAAEAGDVLDAAGYDFVIFETVGVGQSELDIAKTADTTVVCLVPESGDSIQAMKAGLMEIADVFVLNKSDRPGADSAFTSLKSMTHLKFRDPSSWTPEIVKTTASMNIGITELVDVIQNHRDYLVSTDLLNKNRSKHFISRIEEIIISKFSQELWRKSTKEYLLANIYQVTEGKKSPYELADEIYRIFNS